MKLALFADIHSNLEAITACMAHAHSLGADHHAFLGDLVGYGADPAAVLDLVEEHALNGAIVVLGNHDAAALGRPTKPMSVSAEVAMDWTRDRLDKRHRNFLAALPLVERRDNMLFVHASAAAPEDWTYVSGVAEASKSIAAAQAHYVFCGHVHEQQLYFTGADGQPMPFSPVPAIPIPTAGRRHWLAIVGSAGQPRDGNNAACYAFFDSERERLTFFRVPYDCGYTAQKIRAAGLPERLALRIERGA